MQPRDAGDELGDIGVGRVEHDLLGRADLDDDPVLHDRDAVADADRLVEVVGDEDRGLAEVLGQLAELVLQLAADQRVERAERLVHQDDLRVGGQRTGQPDALLHAARELARVALQPVAEADLRQRRLGGPVAVGLRRCPAPRGRRRRSRAPSGAAAARRSGTPSRCCGRASRAARSAPSFEMSLPLTKTLPAARLDQPVQHADQRRLAAARQAHDAEDLAAANLERRVGDADDAAELLQHLASCRGRARRSPSSRRVRVAEDLPDRPAVHQDVVGIGYRL